MRLLPQQFGLTDISVFTNLPVPAASDLLCDYHCGTFAGLAISTLAPMC